MKNLEKVNIVVEYGREFGGEVGFLEVPEWRTDLRYLAARAEESWRVECERVWLGGSTRRKLKEAKHKDKDDSVQSSQPYVKVACVLLTRGGEQA